MLPLLKKGPRRKGRRRKTYIHHIGPVEIDDGWMDGWTRAEQKHWNSQHQAELEYLLKYIYMYIFKKKHTSFLLDILKNFPDQRFQKKIILFSVSWNARFPCKSTLSRSAV